MTKTQPTKRISKIRINKTNNTGTKIVNILTTNNEFAIYEIDHPDINNKLKILINDHTDKSERKIQKQFNSIKQKYIETKGLLSKTTNYNMMKQKITHTLTTYLNSETISNEKEFSILISTIHSNHSLHSLKQTKTHIS